VADEDEARTVKPPLGGTEIDARAAIRKKRDGGSIDRRRSAL
jgi:hypothetical protein